MTPELHAARAEQVLRALGKLTAQDHEMRIEAAMLAGTQLLNAGLHRLGITEAHNDIVHAEYMGGPIRIKADLLAPGLVDLLLQIEMLRPGHVRGDFAGGEQASEQALGLLAELQRRTREDGHGPGAR
ncbi:MAG: hypothetical protein AB7G13_04440 [Lautropia sp.]